MNPNQPQSLLEWIRWRDPDNDPGDQAIRAGIEATGQNPMWTRTWAGSGWGIELDDDEPVPPGTPVGTWITRITRSGRC